MAMGSAGSQWESWRCVDLAGRGPLASHRPPFEGEASPLRLCGSGWSSEKWRAAKPLRCSRFIGWPSVKNGGWGLGYRGSDGDAYRINVCKGAGSRRQAEISFIEYIFY